MVAEVDKITNTESTGYGKFILWAANMLIRPYLRVAVVSSQCKSRTTPDGSSVLKPANEAAKSCIYSRNRVVIILSALSFVPWPCFVASKTSGLLGYGFYRVFSMVVPLNIAVLRRSDRQPLS